MAFQDGGAIQFIAIVMPLMLYACVHVICIA